MLNERFLGKFTAILISVSLTFSNLVNHIFLRPLYVSIVVQNFLNTSSLDVELFTQLDDIFNLINVTFIVTLGVALLPIIQFILISINKSTLSQTIKN